MKAYFNIIAIAIAISTSSCLPPASRGVARSSFNQPGAPLPGAPQPGAPQPGAQSYASFDVFYQELAPYGTWMNNPQYGQVWIPNVGRNFQPYVTRGHWVMTEYGNTWVSHYNWGWAPFHYGRWFLDDYYGWMWVPGNEWGPAWVAWRSGGGYYGWAPLSPGLNVNVNINIGRRIPRSYWSFAPQRYITSPRIYDYCVPRGRVVNVINQTTVINNTNVYNDQHRYYSGPQRRDIERATRRPVRVRQVQASRRPGAASVRGGSVSLYRPEVRSQGVSRGADVNSRYQRTTPRNSAPTRSSYDRNDQSAPAVRSSRSRDNTTRSSYDSRSSEPARGSRQRTSPSRRATPSTATPSRSSGNSRYERRSAPERSPARTESRSSSPSVSPGNSRSGSSRSSSYSRSSDTPTRSSPPTSRSSEPSSSPSRSRSSASPSSSSSSRSSTTQSAPSRAETQSASPSRGSSSTGRTRSGVTRSSRPQR
ncbi:MAG: DUF6600 domain-containing protein [Tunicatimonas sp.]